jgi:hypothetical protein
LVAVTSTPTLTLTLTLTLGLLWLLVYYDIGGLRDPWFTIFIDLDQGFVTGIAQVLFSMAVIEISKTGQEATTYELLITVSNAAITVNRIIATQLLAPLKSIACQPLNLADDDANPVFSSCSSGQVDISSPSG